MKTILLLLFLSLTSIAFSQNEDIKQHLVYSAWHKNDLSEQNQYEIFVLSIEMDSIKVVTLNLIEGFFSASSSYKLKLIDNFCQFELIDLTSEDESKNSFFLYIDTSLIKQDKILIYEANEKLSLDRLKKEKKWTELIRFETD